MNDVLVIGASGGIGSALRDAYQMKGERVDTLSRSHDGFDITSEKHVADQLENRGPYRRVIVATGALEINNSPPEKSIKAITADAMLDQFRLNAVGPALVLSHAHRLLPKDAPSVMAILSARVGSIGDNEIGGWISYRSAKAAVNQVIRTAAIELARTHPQACIIALHPGTVATAFTQKYLARYPSIPPEQAAENLINVIETRSSTHTGQFFDYAGKTIPW